MNPPKKQTTSYYDEFVNPYMPAARAFIIRVEHLGRYLFAKRFLQKHNIKFVFDVGCGDGYGVALLSHVVDRIVGFDLNSSLLQYAEKENTNSKISYLLQDVENTPIQHQGTNPSAIVFFETLEHVADGKKILSHLYEALPAGGYLLLSTPNAQFEPKKKGKSRNAFHKKIYYKHELLQAVVESGFTIEGIYGQPFANFLLHKAKPFVHLLNTLSENSFFLISFFARIIGYPISIFADSSYSLIVVAKKK